MFPTTYGHPRISVVVRRWTLRTLREHTPSPIRRLRNEMAVLRGLIRRDGSEEFSHGLARLEDTALSTRESLARHRSRRLEARPPATTNARRSSYSFHARNAPSNRLRRSSKARCCRSYSARCRQLLRQQDAAIVQTQLRHARAITTALS